MSNTQLIVSPRLKNKVDKYVRYVNIVDVLLWRTQDFPDYGANPTEGASLLFDQIFLKMKLSWGGLPKFVSVDPPLSTHLSTQTQSNHKNGKCARYMSILEFFLNSQ